MALIGRGILYVCLLILTWRFVSQPMGTAAMSSVLHGMNLVFHEAGHVLFLPVGPFLTALGGSLMQLLVPMMCLVALVRQNRDAFGGSLALWWMGENLLDLAPYIADAVALELVLLGGFTGREVEGHDWEAILGALAWLTHASVFGRAAHGLGVVVMVGASVWGARALTVERGRPSVRAMAHAGKPWATRSCRICVTPRAGVWCGAGPGRGAADAEPVDPLGLGGSLTAKAVAVSA